jgi:RHS repeat-associated protein
MAWTLGRAAIVFASVTVAASSCSVDQTAATAHALGECRHVELVATSTQGQSNWTAHQTLSPPAKFAIPNEVLVTQDNAGKHFVVLQLDTASCRYEGGGKDAKDAADSPYTLTSCTNGAVAGDLVLASDVTLTLGNGGITSAKVAIDEVECATGEGAFESRASILGKTIDSSGNPITNATLEVFDVPTTSAPRPDVVITHGQDGAFRARLTQFPDNEGADVPSHHELLRISAAGKLRTYRDVVLRSGDAVDLGPIVLATADPKTTTIGANGGTATDSQSRVSVVIPAGALSSNTAVRVTAFETRDEVSYPLPDSTATTYGFSLEPDGLQFAQPVTVKLANWRNLPTNMDIPVGAFDAANARWTHVGQAKWNGQTFDFQTTHFSVYDANWGVLGDWMLRLHSGHSANNSASTCAGSSIGLANGTLRQTVQLPSYMVRDERLGITLNYDSGLAGSRILHPPSQAGPSTGALVTFGGVGVQGICVARGSGGGSSPGTCSGGTCALGTQGVPIAANTAYIMGQELSATYSLSNGQNSMELGSWISLPQDQQGNTTVGPSWIQQHIVIKLPNTDSACISGGGTFGVGNVSTAPVQANIGQGPVLNLTHRAFMHHRHASPLGAGWAVSGVDRLYDDPLGDRAVLVRGDGGDENFGPHLDVVIGTQSSTQKMRAYAHEYQGDNYILTEDGNTLATLGADMNPASVIFSNLALSSGPESLAVATVNGKRHFVAGLKDALVDIDDLGNVTKLATRDYTTIEACAFVCTPVVYRQAQVATNGSVVFYTDGSMDKPLLQRLDLADQVPTLTTLTTLIGHVELDPTATAGSLQFSSVNGLAFDHLNNRLFVADRMRNVVMLFLPDPNANNAITTDSKVIRVLGDGTATVLPETGERYTGTKIAVNQPALLSVWDNGDLFVGSVFGIGRWIEKAEDFEWLMTSGEDPTSQFDFGLAADAGDASSLMATSPSTFAFLSGRLATIGVTLNGLESRLEPTRTLVLSNNVWTLTDTTSGSSDAFDSTGRMIEHRHRTGEPIFSVQYIGQGSNIDTITDAEGGVTKFTYANAAIASITDPRNRTTQFTMNQARDLVAITDPGGETETFEYDSHHMTKKTSPRGDVSLYEYTSDGTLKKSTKPTGEVSTFTPAMSTEPGVDADGFVIQKGQYIDSRGVTHDVIVDRRGQVTSDKYVADNVNYELTASYGRVLSFNPQLGEIKTWALNNREVNAFKLRRNSILRVAAQYLNGVQLGLWRNYDGIGRIVDVAEDQSASVSRWFVKYDANGWISTVNETNETQLERHITRDNAGRVVDDVDGTFSGQTFIPNTRETKYTYNRSDGQPDTITDHGVVYTLSYDDNGGTKNLLSISDTLGRTQTLTYDTYGNPASVTDGVASSSFTYDAKNRLITATDGASNTTTYGYKEMNCGCTEGDRITTIHTPDLGQNQQWSLDYGPEGRVTKITDPDGNARSIGYTAPGDVNLSTDPLSHASSWTYDSLGRVLTMSDPLGRAHAHAHPTPTNNAWTGVRVMAGSADNTAPPTAINVALGNGQYQVGLSSFQPKGDPPQLEYYRDATFERGIAMQWDAQRRLSVRADQPNVAASQIDPNNINFSIATLREQYGYFHGRAAPVVQHIGASLPNGPNESGDFTVDDYFDTTDAQGFSQSFPWVDDVITRDSAGRVTKVAHNFKSTSNYGTTFTSVPSEYTYASSGYVTQVNNADGEHAFTFDGRGLLSSVSVKGEETQQQVVYGFKYDGVGRNIEIDFPDGHTRTQKYDAEGRILERCYNYTINNNPVVRCYTAKYDAAGNPKTVTDPDGSDALEYDSLNRLTKLTRTVGQQTTVEDYAYNALGALNKNAGTQLDDQRNRLSGNGTADAAVPATFANKSVTLDGSGRITSFKDATMNYDARARLVSVTKSIQNGTETEVYGHDAAMRRIARIRFTTINNQKTIEAEEYYVYEGPNLVGILDKNGAVKQSFLYAGVDQPIRMRANFGANDYFFEVDLAGNVRRLTAYGGADLGGYRYTAFGIPDANQPAPQIDQPLRWKGRPWSDFSSLYEVRARQWSPELGVFTAIDEHSYHDARATLWGWVGSNPIVEADFSGHGDDPAEKLLSSNLLPPGLTIFGKGVRLRAGGLELMARASTFEAGLTKYECGNSLIALGASITATDASILVGTAQLVSGVARSAAEGAIGRGPRPTFLNRGDPSGGTLVGTLTRSGERFGANGGQIPAGTYDFVVQGGDVQVGLGHYFLAEGGPVEYAGTITFDDNGVLLEWTNASGHYRPSGNFAANAGLPMDAFRAVDFPAMVGRAEVALFREP